MLSIGLDTPRGKPIGTSCRSTRKFCIVRIERYTPIGRRGIHGAEFLRDLFSDVTESKLSYDKVIHSVKLTEWLLRHNLDHLKGLVEYVSGLVGLSKAP